MADDLNSLLQANRSSSVLQGIMNPAQVNPLAAMTSAAQTAGTIFDMRQKQATQAAGEAYQGAIDPQTGEFDPNKFRMNLQAAGPVAAMAAGPALANTQSISSDQLNQMRAKAGWANTAAGSLTRLGPNITQADAIGTLHQGVTQGILTQPEFERQVAELATLGNDPAKLHAWASQHQFNAMSTQQQLEQTYGTTGSQTGPSGTTIGFTQAPASRGGGISTQPQQGAPQGLTPGERETLVPVSIPVDKDGQPTTPDKAVRYQPMSIPRGSLPMAGPPGGGPAPNPSGATTVPAGVPPPGTIPGTGRITPPPALAGPGGTGPGGVPTDIPFDTPTPASPAPAVPAPASTPVVKTPAGNAVITGPPQGQPEQLAANQKAYMEDQAAVPASVTRMQNMQHAYDALSQLKSATGKGAQGINDLRSYAQTLGILPAGAVTEQQLVEVINKYTERAMLDAAGGTGTDLARQMQAQANPNTGLSTPANLELLRNDLGNAMQKAAANTLHDPATGGVGYLQARADLARNTDPRGFVWNFYSKPEQDKILADVKGTPADEKLHRAIGMSLDPKLQIPQIAPPPVRQKQSFNAPPPVAAQNPLLMLG